MSNLRALVLASSVVVTVASFGVAACGGGAAAPAESPAGSSTVATAGTQAAAIDTSVAPATAVMTASPSGTGVKLQRTDSPAEGAAKRNGEPGRTGDDIQAMVVANRDKARACYDKAEATHQGIEGDITIGFVIDPKGVVKDVAVDPARTNLPDNNVGPCIVDVIRQLKFPASPKGLESKASYPFNFHPKTKAYAPVAPPKP